MSTALFCDDPQETRQALSTAPHSCPSCPPHPCTKRKLGTYQFRPQQTCPLLTLELLQHLQRKKTQSLFRIKLVAMIRPEVESQSPVPNLYLPQVQEGLACLVSSLRNTEAGCWLSPASWSLTGLQHPPSNPGQEFHPVPSSWPLHMASQTHTNHCLLPQPLLSLP